MEAQASFIRPDRAVKLYAEAAIDLYLVVVVYPCYAEHDLAFRLYDPVKDPRRHPFGMLLRHWFKGFQNLCHGLMKFRFVRVSLLAVVQNFLKNLHKRCTLLPYINFFVFCKQKQAYFQQI